MKTPGYLNVKSAILGHSVIETTMRYAHLAPAHLASKSSVVTYQVPVEGNVVRLTRMLAVFLPSQRQKLKRKKYQIEL